jgi:hypothetical protein
MGSLHLGVSGAPVANMLVIKDPERVHGDLIDLSRQAAQACASRQFIEPANAILLGRKLDEDCLHERSPFLGSIPARLVAMRVNAGFKRLTDNNADLKNYSNSSQFPGKTYIVVQASYAEVRTADEHYHSSSSRNFASTL